MSPTDYNDQDGSDWMLERQHDRFQEGNIPTRAPNWNAGRHHHYLISVGVKASFLDGITAE
jgi:hypothetical protein